MGDQRVMTSLDGRFVAAKKTRDGMRLCVEEAQSNEPFVYIVTRKDEKQMALHFRHEDGNYVTKVDGNKLVVNKLEKSTDSTNLPDNHWFEKYNGKVAGEHYGLRSVVQPWRYLSIQSNNVMHHIILSEDSNACVLVKDKMP